MNIYSDVDRKNKLRVKVFVFVLCAELLPEDNSSCIYMRIASNPSSVRASSNQCEIDGSIRHRG